MATSKGAIQVALPNFKASEVSCPCGCGLLPSTDALIRLQTLRTMYGAPIFVTSGARCAKHHEELRVAQGKSKKDWASKSQHVPGDWNNNQSQAFDLAVRSSAERATLLDLAIRLGFTGIGIGPDFLHIDIRNSKEVAWTYYH